MGEWYNTGKRNVALTGQFPHASRNAELNELLFLVGLQKIIDKFISMDLC